MITRETDYFETCDVCKSRAEERYSAHFTHFCYYCRGEICNKCFSENVICGIDNEGYAYTHSKELCEAC